MKRPVMLAALCTFLVVGCSTNPGDTTTPANTSNASTNTVAKSNNSGQTSPVQNAANGTPTQSWSADVPLFPQEVENNTFQLLKFATLAEPKQFRVTGKMRAFEAVGATRLLVDGHPIPQSADGNAVVTIHASEGAPAWGDFHVDYQYPASLSGHMAVVEFYVNSPKDGSPVNKVQVRIQLP